MTSRIFWAGARRLQQRLPGLYPAEVVFAEDQADLAVKIAEADGVIVESLASTPRCSRGAPRLAVVQKFGTLTANIDLAACAARGVAVETLHRMVNVAVAEQAFALLLALAKRIVEFNGVVEEEALRAAGYKVRPRQSRYIGYSNFAGITGLKTVHGATLGIVGFGEVGREVAHRARAFAMKVVYFQRTPLSARVRARTRRALSAARRTDGAVGLHPGAAAAHPRDARADRPRRALPHQARRRADRRRPRRADRPCRRWSRRSTPAASAASGSMSATPSRPIRDEPLLRHRGGNVILMPHTAIGARANALHDVETLCLNLWRGVTRTLTA